MPGLDQPADYIIKVQGGVDASLVDWFGPLHMARASSGDHMVTTLSGIVTDQAGLVGLIRHLHGLGITLLSVERTADDQ